MRLRIPFRLPTSAAGIQVMSVETLNNSTTLHDEVLRWITDWRTATCSSTLYPKDAHAMTLHGTPG